ncbi:MAG: hypothetical protein M1830_004785 [Pleopsidium flavum]|nr:MAG: hypothetical protein M1830_004785 [Pleopsidium flavum]
MGLVEYTDSEGSDTEGAPAPPAPSKSSSSTSTKPAFQKVVDRSNPHKIRINLPDVTREKVDQQEVDGGERSAKRTKTGGGAFSGFNSFLPAPKRASQALSGGQGRGRGLGSGVNLITGSSPGFSREVEPGLSEVEANPETQMVSVDIAPQQDVADTSGGHGIDVNTGPWKPKPRMPPIGTPMMFKPLSVARKPQKQKASLLAGSISSTNGAANASKPAKSTPNVSLFSMGKEHFEACPSRSSNGEYEPLLYNGPQVQAKAHSPEPLTEINSDENITLSSATTHDTTFGPSSGPQSLDSIASDLNLSASAKRQLLGRQRNSKNSNSSEINISNFNTDEEYAANEVLRAAGEQVQHNPVRAIAPGKHNLKQLVSAASNQKDALEEHFASGKRNKKEAGSKYGW